MMNTLSHIVNAKALQYSLYIVVGFVISHYSHIYVYRIRGGQSLMTWYKLLNITSREPSVLTVYLLCLLLIVVQFLALQIAIPNVEKSSFSQILKVGAIFIVAFTVGSQLISSSVMRLSYETLICSIVLVSILLKQIFLTGESANMDRYNELWDLLKFVTPLCIGIPILMGSAGFITSFFQNEQTVIKLQLYRHVAMTLYFAIGTFLFILYPIILEILRIREKLS